MRSMEDEEYSLFTILKQRAESMQLAIAIERTVFKYFPENANVSDWTYDYH